MDDGILRQRLAEDQQPLLQRLAAAGIDGLAGWRALTPHQKKRIFGITNAMRAALDAIAGR